MNEKTTPSARVLVFTGDGKGKTTAALGMVLRAAGHRMSAAVVQFVKNDLSTGELASLGSLGVQVSQCGLGFLPPPDSPQVADHRAAAEHALAVAEAAIAAGTALVVLDEACLAVARHLLPEQRVIDVVRSAAADQVIVLTGRDAPAALVSLADTVTEMRCVKHGFNAGRRAQQGVEW